MSSKSTPPRSPADMLEHLAKDLRELAQKALATANDAEAIAKAFRGQA